MKKLSSQVINYLNNTGMQYSIETNLLNRKVIVIGGFRFVPDSITTGKTLVIDITGAILPIHYKNPVDALQTVFPALMGTVYTMQRPKQTITTKVKLLFT